MKSKPYIFILVIAIMNQLNAQTFKSMSVGDSLPDFKVSKILRWNKENVRTSDFNDRLLIIDIWATHCGSCVEAMSHLQSLQKYYGEKIMILPVTYQAAGEVSAFMQNNRYFRDISLPSVVEDKIFSQLFPHRSIAHEIWVYKGKIIGITLSSYVDKVHIDDVLAGRKANLPLKYDFYEFDPGKLLFNIGTAQIGRENIETTYTFISGFKQRVNSDGVFAGSDLTRDKDMKTIRFYYINESIFYLYQILFNKISEEERGTPILLPLNNVSWEVADRSKYRYQPELGIKYDWTASNAICFESVQLDTGQSNIEVYRRIIGDLNRMLGLNVHWEKRKQKVYIARNRKKSGTIKYIVDEKRPFIFVWELLSLWNHIEDRPYLVDETVGLRDKKINFDDGEEKNISVMKDKLDLCGIELTQEDRVIENLVFSEVGCTGKLR